MKNALATLRSHLQTLETLARSAHPDGSRLQAQFLLSQQQFQNQLLPLGDLHPDAQPVLTEMNRTFRLLAIDVAFLQAARQSLTAQRRQRQLGDKLDQLLGFCAALEQTVDPIIAEE